MWLVDRFDRFGFRLSSYIFAFRFLFLVPPLRHATGVKEDVFTMYREITREETNRVRAFLLDLLPSQDQSAGYVFQHHE